VAQEVQDPYAQALIRGHHDYSTREVVGQAADFTAEGLARRFPEDLFLLMMADQLEAELAVRLWEKGSGEVRAFVEFDLLPDGEGGFFLDPWPFREEEVTLNFLAYFHPYRGEEAKVVEGWGRQDTLRFLLREAVRETVTEVLQTVLELDRTAFLQAHGGRRNGYYPRRLETTFGQVDLKVPRDREGQYYPAFLKPYARRLVDVGEVAIALYAAGVSQRKAAEVMGLLLGHRYSHETISAMTEEVLQGVEAFRRRPLPEEMAFVYLDGLYLKLLREGEGVVREVVYVALGVTPSGERQVLGYWLLPAESALGWEGVLGELWQRGLRRVLLFITDGLPGLPEAIRRVYPQAEWQRCVVHGVRWSLGQVRARDRTLLAEDLRRVYGAESREEALEALEALREAWGARYPGVVALWAGDSGAFLRFLRIPQGALAVLAEHQPDGEVHSGDPAGDEGARPQVSQRGGGVQAPLPGVGEARREVGGEEA
jgi:putative transposase